MPIQLLAPAAADPPLSRALPPTWSLFALTRGHGPPVCNRACRFLPNILQGRPTHRGTATLAWMAAPVLLKLKPAVSALKNEMPHFLKVTGNGRRDPWGGAHAPP